MPESETHPSPNTETMDTTRFSDVIDDSALADWLAPVDDADACGPDLEYDNDFLALTQAAAGKAETQFSAAEPPDWSQVRQLAQDLNQRTRDLRVARYWLRARLHTDGFAALAPCLHLFEQMLANWWEELHPRLEDGEAFARLNVLGELASLDALLGDVRQSLVLDERSIGQVSVREIEIALGRLNARDDESPPSRDQIESMLRDAAEQSPAIAQQAPAALAALDALEECLSPHVGYGDMPDFTALREMLTIVQTVSPTKAEDNATDEVESTDSGDDSAQGTSAGWTRPRSAGLGSIDSREDAVRAIGMVCDYLERNEPTNPAANLLRRAQRLIDRNFLQLVREFAPEALGEVARVLGVDPESIDNANA